MFHMRPPRSLRTRLPRQRYQHVLTKTTIEEETETTVGLVHVPVQARSAEGTEAEVARARAKNV